MSYKPPYLSGGRGRGQSSPKRTGYVVGNLVLDRKVEKKKAKLDTKPVIVNDSTNVVEQRKHRQRYEIGDTRRDDITTEMDYDTPVDKHDVHQEQILENVMKSYKKGSSDSKCLTVCIDFDFPLKQWIWHRCKKHYQNVYK